MTIVVWDGKTLASDSRRTCGRRYDDDVVKLKRHHNLMYNGLRVLWSGWAGKVAYLTDLNKFLDAQPGHAELTQLLQSECGIQVSHKLFSGMFLLENNSIVTLRIDKDTRRFVFSDVDPGEYVAIGTGAKTMQLIHNMFCSSDENAVLSAIEMVELTSRFSNSCGGRARWVTVESTHVKTASPLTKKTRNRLASKFRTVLLTDVEA